MRRLKVRNKPASACVLESAVLRSSGAPRRVPLIAALICYYNVPQLCGLCELCGEKRHKYITFLILNYRRRCHWNTDCTDDTDTHGFKLSVEIRQIRVIRVLRCGKSAFIRVYLRFIISIAASVSIGAPDS
ncbi:MAG: hypothetical protein O8C67_11940 [Candidatus Methanoperedens sp.]|nr:hypothetical protein [Candidatus Methanoperedens sp.]